MARQIQTTEIDLTPPGHLSARSRALWCSIVPRRAKSPERLVLLQVALEALDRADAAQALIAAEGMVTVTARSGVAHLHPVLRIERESRVLFCRIWSELGLNRSQVVDVNKWP